MSRVGADERAYALGVGDEQRRIESAIKSLRGRPSEWPKEAELVRAYNRAIDQCLEIVKKGMA